jgi:integrase
MGEMLALTWDCIDISRESIRNGTAYVFVKKEMQRVDVKALEALGDKDVMFKFPPTMTRNTTTLVLKKPKTRTSIRKIFLPKTVAEMLIERKQRIEEYQELFGREFTDYNLVFCHPDGKPMENSVITRMFKQLIADNNLPPVVFHSLRHTSVTYKLKLNGGDIKSVQGDSGHSQINMVTDVYSHIIDEDRQKNAQLFEERFYSSKEDRPEEILEATPVPASTTSPKEDTLSTLLKIMQNPEAAELLKALAKNL